MSLPARASLRYLLRRSGQLGLALLGLALGVAVVVAVDLANTSASRAFELSLETVSGAATHRIVGGPRGLDEALYRRLRLAAGIRASAPVLEGFIEARGENLHLLGVDPFAEAPFRGDLASGGSAPLERLMTEPGSVLMGRVTARRLGLERGQRFDVDAGGRTRQLRLLGYLDPGRRPPAALDGLVIADIASAQTVLGRLGRLSRIDLKRPPGADADRWRARIEAVLPASARLVDAQARDTSTARLARAFQINLTAMSLLALLVGMFLIYNTMTFSVLQRRALLGDLRVLGVSRAEIFRLVLVEALVMGALAGALGVPLGVLLGNGLVELVTRTIDDLYFNATVSALWVTPGTVVKGVALGVVATVAAALAPALEAAATPPRHVQLRSSIEHRARALAPRLAALGFGLMAVGALLLLPGRSLVVGFVALFVLVLGFALATPLAVVGCARLAAPLLQRAAGVQGRLLARALETGLSRTGVATAALVVAVSTTVGVAIMIASFRSTVELWLTNSLQAQVYVSAPSHGARGSAAAIDPQVVTRLRELPGVAAASSARRARVESEYGPTELHAIDLAPQSAASFRFKSAPAAQVWPAFDRDAAVVVSEPYAYRHSLEVGAALELYTAHGPRAFRVAGVFYDYASEQGVVVMRRALYARLWDDPAVSSLGLYLAPKISTDAVLARVRAATRGEPLLARAAGEIRRQTLAVFDRTFTITEVLRLLAVLVAFVGVLSALTALQLERGREVAVRRALGMTRAQVAGSVLGETALLGLVAGLLSIPLGIVMSRMLTEVINRRAFGWTMQSTIPADALAQAVLLAVAAALLAGAYPAWRMARARPAEGLRAE